MSLAEIKDRVAELSPEERLDLAAFLLHLNRSDDPQYQAEMDRRLDRTSKGQKHSSTDLIRLHESLSAQGR
jgi:hypothetical protein